MRQKETIGAIIRVPIDEKYHTYGRIINSLVYAFYDMKTNSEITDLDLIEKSNILFKLIVHKSAVTQGYWKIIGVRELPQNLKEPVPFFKQEIGNLNDCSIVIDGNSKKVSPKDCIGLERLAVWGYPNVEQRLLDHYNGVPNKYTQAIGLNMIP